MYPNPPPAAPLKDRLRIIGCRGAEQPAVAYLALPGTLESLARGAQIAARPWLTACLTDAGIEGKGELVSERASAERWQSRPVATCSVQRKLQIGGKWWLRANATFEMFLILNVDSASSR